jgi:hypothetical protein
VSAFEETDMSTRRIAFAGVLTASAIVIGAGGPSPVALAAGAPAAAAQVQTCWDFAELDQTHHFKIGETFLASTATIEMKNYLLNGAKANSPAAVAYATQTQIAGGPAPEFRLYLINAHVTPNTPASMLTYRFGHFVNGGSGVAHANLGVNGELVEVTTGLASLNGRVLGDPAIGTAQVTVTMLTLPGANPERGTLQLQALTGTIEKASIGGVQEFIKDVCFQ